jgi:8-oxo-dGTP pyrophosphatase MutT (NUDIX family)
MPTVELPGTEKVVAYVVRDDRLVVFIHEDDTDPVRQSGLQVPAGTCESRETPSVAVLREAHEETGLDALRIVRYLGDADYDMRPYTNAVHHRHFFHLAVDGPVPDEWRHLEQHSGAEQPPAFRFFWLPVRQAHVLACGQGALLGRLADD